MSRESKCLKLLATGILDFLGINCFFLVRKNICCHLLDFILHHHQCKVGPIFWLFYLEMCYHCLLQSWLDTNLCVWSVPHVSVNVLVCEHWHWEPYAGSTGALWLSSLFQPCILWARRVFSFLQVSGGSNPCYSVLHDCIPGFVWGGKMLPRSNAREVGRSAAAKLWNESTTG